MNKLFRKRIIFPIIGAIALVFSMVWAFLATPDTYAAVTMTTLTSSDIFSSNGAAGNKDGWSWGRYEKSGTSMVFRPYVEDSGNMDGIQINYQVPTDVDNMTFSYSFTLDVTPASKEIIRFQDWDYG